MGGRTTLNGLALLEIPPVVPIQILGVWPHRRLNQSCLEEVKVQPLGWLDESRLVLIRGAVNPDNGDPNDLGLLIEEMDISQKTSRRITWLPHTSHGFELWEAWLSGDKSEVFLERSTDTGMIEGIDIKTGKYRLIKKGLRFCEIGGYPVISVAANKDYLIYDLFTQDSPKVLDLKTGTAVKLVPDGTSYGSPVWAPHDDLIAVQVGVPGEKYKILLGEDSNFLLASSIWVLDPRGKQIHRIHIPGEVLGNPVWTPDDKSLVFQSLEWKEGKEEWDWKVIGKEVYRADFEGKTDILYPNSEKHYFYEAINEWIIGGVEGQQVLALSTLSGKTVELPSNSHQVLAGAEGRIITYDKNILEP